MGKEVGDDNSAKYYCPRNERMLKKLSQLLTDSNGSSRPTAKEIRNYAVGPWAVAIYARVKNLEDVNFLPATVARMLLTTRNNSSAALREIRTLKNMQCQLQVSSRLHLNSDGLFLCSSPSSLCRFGTSENATTTKRPYATRQEFGTPNRPLAFRNTVQCK